MNRPSPDDMKDIIMAEQRAKIKELEKENKELKEHKENLIRADKKKTEHIEELEKKYKELKEENKKLKAYKSLYILLKERINWWIEIQNKLRTENKTLKEKLVLTENDRDEWKLKATEVKAQLNDKQRDKMSFEKFMLIFIICLYIFLWILVYVNIKYWVFSL